MKNLMVMFTFFIFNQKYPFLDNLVKKIKIVSLRWNLIHALIPISRIQWWCLLFFDFDQKCPFWTDLLQNVEVVSLKWKLFTFSVFDGKYSFWANLVEKAKIISLSWNSKHNSNVFLAVYPRFNSVVFADWAYLACNLCKFCSYW